MDERDDRHNPAWEDQAAEDATERAFRRMGEEDYADYLALRAERDRLAAWLKRIEGGDNPCRDEDQLRQWAYEAITLGHEPPEEG